MYTTSCLEPISMRLEMINSMIQQLVDSGHKFSYVKSILLQGLSKYQFMVYRDRLDTDHKLYTPIYRARTFRQQERKMEKYIKYSTWYADLEPSDPYRPL